ncbi:unnamed protein product [Danaus chrysippus]|uniref:(African queen) hypothetical protein n=1 Tax=Danaus chrysippus TaxID=151541 RepID=A0A8J2QPV5_9NEOP|nr:unnamed protein product [Danaus chrysippus]
MPRPPSHPVPLTPTPTDRDRRTGLRSLLYLLATLISTRVRIKKNALPRISQGLLAGLPGRSSGYSRDRLRPPEHPSRS